MHPSATSLSSARSLPFGMSSAGEPPGVQRCGRRPGLFEEHDQRGDEAGVGDLERARRGVPRIEGYQGDRSVEHDHLGQRRRAAAEPASVAGQPPHVRQGRGVVGVGVRADGPDRHRAAQQRRVVAARRGEFRSRPRATGNERQHLADGLSRQPVDPALHLVHPQEPLDLLTPARPAGGVGHEQPDDLGMGLGQAPLPTHELLVLVGQRLLEAQDRVHRRESVGHLEGRTDQAEFEQPVEAFTDQTGGGREPVGDLLGGRMAATRSAPGTPLPPSVPVRTW